MRSRASLAIVVMLTSATAAADVTTARARFRSHAAGALQIAPAQVVVHPVDDQTVGAAWAFAGTDQGRPPKEVRGWATADGTVITRDANLGVLFEQAGVWTAKPALDAHALGERLVWTMGMYYRLTGAVTLTLDASGNGALRFRLTFQQPGGPPVRSQCTVTLTAHHHAQLAVTAAPIDPGRDSLE